jgi:hypothetical protein
MYADANIEEVFDKVTKFKATNKKLHINMKKLDHHLYNQIYGTCQMLLTSLCHGS